MLTIDGIHYEVKWTKFVPTASITIPCLNPDKTREYVRQKLAEHDITAVYRTVEVDGIICLRVWRA